MGFSSQSVAWYVDCKACVLIWFCVVGHKVSLGMLIVKAGHPELKDAFCNGDVIYFERYQPNLTFKRPQKIGSGDDVCEFIFEIKNP